MAWEREDRSPLNYLFKSLHSDDIMNTHTARQTKSIMTRKLCYIRTLEDDGLLQLTLEEERMILLFAQMECKDGPWPSLHSSIGVHYLRMLMKGTRELWETTHTGAAVYQSILQKTKSALTEWYAR